MSLPKTYKHAVFKEQGGPLTVEVANLTPPGKGEVLVKVEACGVCFSDMFAQNNIMGAGFPMTPGHEIIGRVAAVGDEDSPWKVGDRVGAGWHGGHDGTCYACKHGHFQMCSNAAINGETKAGGYAEYAKIRTEAVVRVPTHVDAAKYAPVLCAGVATFNAIRKQNIAPGSLVAIQGLGGLGHLAIQYAHKMGYRVAALSRDGSKEKFAKHLGADVYIDATKGDTGEQLQNLGGASLIVATAPTANAIQPLLKGLGILGKLVILSVPGPITVDTATMLPKALSIQCWPSGHAIDSEEAIEFTELKNIDCMIEKFPLAKANDAFDAMMANKVSFRAVITMD